MYVKSQRFFMKGMIVTYTCAATVPVLKREYVYVTQLKPIKFFSSEIISIMIFCRGEWGIFPNSDRTKKTELNKR